MTNQYLVGIDIGTSGCKVALFAADGTVLFQGTKSYTTYYPMRGTPSKIRRTGGARYAITCATC